MTRRFRTEKWSNKIADWEQLKIGDYFYHSEFEDLCIKVTPENYFAFAMNNIYHIDNTEESFICEVNATVTWERVFEKEN